MALRVNHAFVRQPVKIGRVHIVVAKSVDRIEALLVSDDKDDIRALVAHGRRIFSACGSEKIINVKTDSIADAVQRFFPLSR